MYKYANLFGWLKTTPRIYLAKADFHMISFPYIYIFVTA